MSLVNGSVFVSVRLCSLVLGVLTFYFGLAGAAPLLLRVGALSLLVSFQVSMLQCPIAIFGKVFSMTFYFKLYIYEIKSKTVYTYH